MRKKEKIKKRVNNTIVAVALGIRQNTTTGKYYVRAKGKYIGSYTSLNKAKTAFKRGH